MATCRVKDGADLILEGELRYHSRISHLTNVYFAASECVTESGKKACEEIGGDCVTERDGYYYVSSICVAIGVVSLVVYIIPTARRLQCKWSILLHISSITYMSVALHASKWKVNLNW